MENFGSSLYRVLHTDDGLTELTISALDTLEIVRKKIFNKLNIDTNRMKI